MMMSPLFSKFVIDEIIFKSQSGWLNSAVLIMAGIMVVSLALNWLRSSLMLETSRRLSQKIASDACSHLLSLNILFFENRKSGDITTRLGEHRKISNFLTHNGVHIPANICATIGYLCLMAWFNVSLCVISVGFVILHILAVQVVAPRVRQL